MNLVALLAERAAEHPERPAILDFHDGKDRSVSFGELARRVSAGAAFLRRHGFGRGKTVLVFHPVSIELYEFLLSAFHVGARVMLADPSAGRKFLSQCCHRQMPDAFFGSWKAQVFRWMIPELRGLERNFRSGGWFPGSVVWDASDGSEPLSDLPADEPALITFTSGSTGVPKAAVRTHGFLLAQHRALSRSLDFEEGEVDLITLPVFVLANLASGLTSVIAATNLAKPGEADADAVTAQCVRQGVTRCAASPAFYEALLKSRMPDFRKVYAGGAPVFPDLLRRLRGALPSARIEAVYGSTEAEPIAHSEADESAAGMTRAGAGLCAGVPVPEIRLRIMKDRWGQEVGPLDGSAFDEMTVAAGQAGEIIVAGEHVLKGYLGGIGDGETKIHVDGGIWHRTGDAGWMDERGCVWLLGRCSEKMNCFPVVKPLPADAFRYPFAIECALREIFPEVRMAALEWKGKRTLVVGKSAEEERIGDEARRFGMEKVIYLDALPLDRRHQAKIDYPQLRLLLDKTK